MATRWSELTPEQKEEARRNRKRRKYLADIGRSPEVPAGPVMQHVRRLHDEGGMSFKDISRATGPNPVYPGTIADLYRGQRAGNRSHEKVKRARRETVERLLALPVPEKADEASCAYVPVCGVRRRLQALACAGYGAMSIATYMDRDHKQVWRDMTGKRVGGRGDSGQITAGLRSLYRDVYRKLIQTEPEDIGVTPLAIGRAKGMAKRYGWAPDHCWDDDTIDDPNAIAEWTGACGTVHGRSIHMREDIPMCQPCRTAFTNSQRERRGELPIVRGEFDRDAFKQIFAGRDMMIITLAEKTGFHKDSITSWMNGRRNPAQSNIPRLAVALGVQTEDLIK
jgi:hypothetical protein